MNSPHWIIALTSALLLLSVGCARSFTSLDKAQERGLLDGYELVRVRYEKQSVGTLCGLACLVSVIDAWDVKADQYSLLKGSPPKDLAKGYSLGELKAIASELELNGFAVNGSPEFLEEQLSSGRPVIVALRRKPREEGKENPPSHAVVVCGFNSTSYLLMDPSRGFTIVEKERLNEPWEQTGRACLLVSR